LFLYCSFLLYSRTNTLLEDVLKSIQDHRGVPQKPAVLPISSLAEMNDFENIDENRYTNIVSEKENRIMYIILYLSFSFLHKHACTHTHTHTHTHTRARARARTHARTHARMHAHTHFFSLSLSLSLSFTDSISQLNVNIIRVLTLYINNLYLLSV